MQVLDSNHPEAPKIEFPCENYCIKVMGQNEASFRQYVVETIASIVDDFDSSKVKETVSRKATFTSVTLYITATGVEQLRQIDATLKQDKRVKMVL